jgi:hypothetical protein
MTRKIRMFFILVASAMTVAGARADDEIKLAEHARCGR